MSNMVRHSIKHEYAEISALYNGDKSCSITVEEFNDNQWFARINLSNHQLIQLRDFLNEFIEANNEK